MKKLKTYYYLDKTCSIRDINFYKITTDIEYDHFVDLIHDEAHKFLDSGFLINKEKFLSETDFNRTDYMFDFKGNPTIRFLSRTGADKEKIRKTLTTELNPITIEMSNQKKRNNVFYYLDCINLEGHEEILFYKILSDYSTTKDFFYYSLSEIVDSFNYKNGIEYEYWINDYNIGDYESDYAIPYEYNGNIYYFSHFSLMLKHERKKSLTRRLTPNKGKILTEDLI